MNGYMSSLQRQALQRFAIAAAERERARRHMHVAEQTMREAQREATRHGNLVLPATAELLDGAFVTLDFNADPADSFLKYTVAPALLEVEA